MNEMNKIITSEGNVQFQTPDGKIINVHPFHIYTVYNEDTVSFLLIAMPKSSGLAIFTSKAEDLEVDGTVYTIDELPNALSEAFAKAGAVARYEIVDELPTSGQSNTIYLVPKSEGVGYDEYIYVNGEWELIGDTDIELDRYVTKEVFSGYTADTLVLINTVSGDVITESERAISAETALQEAIDNEVSARTADVEALSGAVDNVQDEVDILSAALEDEVSARTQADEALQGLIDTVSGDVETEVSRATSAETELQTAINNETSARTDADTALGNKIDGKVVELTQAQYDALQDKDPLVLYVITDAVEVNMNDYYKKTETSGATELSTAFANETSARTDADAALSASKANKSEAVASAEYVSSSTTIDLKDISGNVISQVDASDFIIDGMVDDVKIENGYLVITFNTDSGKQDIQIPLTDIFDPSDYYDKTAIDNIVSGINESIDTKFDASGITAYSTSAEVTAEINAATSGKVNTSDFETYSGNVETALNSKLDATAYTPTDLSNYYTKDETSGATEIATALNGKANTTDIYTYIDGRGIKVQNASGTRRKSINLNVPIYSGSAVGAVSCNIESGTINGLNNISGGTSFGAGFMVKTKNNSEAAFGKNNVTRQTNSGGAWGANYVSGNTLLSVGNGDDGHAHNAFEIRQNGDIYITSGGTDASWYSKPMVKLQDALGGKQETLVAGSGITISGNVISAEAQPITVDNALDDSSENPVQNKVLYDELRIVENNDVILEWENNDGGYTTNYPIGTPTLEFYVDESQMTEGYFTLISNIEQDSEGFIYIQSNNGTVTVADSSNVTYSISGNVVTVTIDASVVEIVDEISSSYDNYWTVKAVNSTATPLIDKVGEIEEVTAAALNNINDRLSEDEEVTASGLNALNDKFGGLKLMKITQAAYDALTVKDNNTLYIISD